MDETNIGGVVYSVGKRRFLYLCAKPDCEGMDRSHGQEEHDEVFVPMFLRKNGAEGCAQEGQSKTHGAGLPPAFDSERLTDEEIARIKADYRGAAAWAPNEIRLTPPFPWDGPVDEDAHFTEEEFALGGAP